VLPAVVFDPPIAFLTLVKGTTLDVLSDLELKRLYHGTFSCELSAMIIDNTLQRNEKTSKNWLYLKQSTDQK